MITTKKGKSQKGIGISFDSSVSVGTVDKSTFASYQNQYGQGYFPSFRATYVIASKGLETVIIIASGAY